MGLAGVGAEYENSAVGVAVVVLTMLRSMVQVHPKTPSVILCLVKAPTLVPPIPGGYRSVQFDADDWIAR